MKQHIQTFSKGITQDISTNKFPKDNIYWAENFRLVSKDGLATGALTNVQGNLSKIALGAGHSIINTVQIRDTLVIFVASDEGGKIFKWDANLTDEEESATLIYHDENLNFDIDHPVRAVGRYETPMVQKIYFTDGLTFFKHLNIIPEEGKPALLDYPLESLDLVANIAFSPMELAIKAGGNLKASRIQYAYQLYNRRGSESSISPGSRMLSLTDSSETGSSSINYTGAEVGDIVNKSVEVTIDNVDDIFERIRVFALEYTVFDQVPSIRIVGEYEIDFSSTVVLDSGQSIGELTLEEFRFIQHDFYPKSLDTKDNILFAANLVEDKFYLSMEEFDTRAFRFNSSNLANVEQGSSIFPIEYLSATEELSAVPDIKHDCYNPFNAVDSAYLTPASLTTAAVTDRMYKYNPATGELGGLGLNISYKFTTKRVLLDSGTYDKRGYLAVFPSITSEVDIRENHSNPFTDIGYQRDEVYRFAFVPKDTKGREGFAMWIGDIKFPSNMEMPFIEFDESDNKTYANILGIEFTVNIPDTVKEKISGYVIARVDRRSQDKTVVAQGLIGYLSNGGPKEGVDEFHMMSQASVPLIGDLNSEVTYTYKRQSEELSTAGDNNDPSVEAYYTSPKKLPIEDSGEKGFNPKYIEFTSPETVFNKQELTKEGAFIEAFGTLNNNQFTAMTGPTGDGDKKFDDYEMNQLVSDKFRGLQAGKNEYATRAFLETNKVYIARNFQGTTDDASNNPTIELVDDRIFNNKTCNLVITDDKERWRRYGIRGTFTLCTVKGDYADIDNNKLPVEEFYRGNTIEALIGNYKVDKGKSQYGGSNYEARTYNTYYPASEFIDKDTSVVDVYGGDTFINYFAYARSLFGTAVPEDGDTIESYVFFPVESSINLNLRLDNLQKYINWGWHESSADLGVPRYKIEETLQQGVLNFGTSYPQELGDLYRYNSVYSATNKSKEYIAEPFDFVNREEFDTRITASDVKINGEYTDSWTKFKYNEFLDVDSKHGAITRILTFKNQLYYFQPTAVGIAAVNQRSLIKDNQPGALTLGTGTVLPRYDYVTDKSGSDFYDGIVGSDNFLYYADGRRKRFNKLIPGKEEAISVIKGIDSLLDKKRWYTAVTGFDRGYNEILFNVDDVTLVFSELADGFMGEYSFTSKHMFSIGKNFYSVAEDRDYSPWKYGDLEFDLVGYSGNTDVDPTWDFVIIGPDGMGDTIYKHNVGEAGNFYNAPAPADSVLSLIINPMHNQICVFDLFDMRTESTKNGVDVVTDIFYRLEASTNYQEISRELAFVMDLADPVKGYTFNEGSIKRIGRVWRTPILPEVASGFSSSRVMDTYLKATLKYSNSANNKFKLHDVVCHYRPARH